MILTQGKVNETTKLMGMGISYSVHRNCKGNLASDKNKRLLLLSLFSFKFSFFISPIDQ